jgi:hypothetical protein
VAKGAQGRGRKDSRKLGDLLKNRHGDSLKTYSFCGMLKKRDAVDNADYDEVRTSVPKNHATSTLSTEEFILRTQYL